MSIEIRYESSGCSCGEPVVLERHQVMDLVTDNVRRGRRLEWRCPCGALHWFGATVEQVVTVRNYQQPPE